jgi:hypothetical protein
VLLADARRDGHALADETRRDAVVVALERDQRRAADDALGLKLRRERSGRQAEQAILAGELGNRARAALAAIGDRDRPSCLTVA